METLQEYVSGKYATMLKLGQRGRELKDVALKSWNELCDAREKHSVLCNFVMHCDKQKHIKGELVNVNSFDKTNTKENKTTNNKKQNKTKQK